MGTRPRLTFIIIVISAVRSIRAALFVCRRSLSDMLIHVDQALAPSWHWSGAFKLLNLPAPVAAPCAAAG